MLSGGCVELGPRSFGHRVAGLWVGKLMRTLFG